MSSSEIDLESSDGYSEDSEMNFTSEYEVEAEGDADFSISLPTSEYEGAATAFADDPLADVEWTAEYEKEMKADKELEEKLKERLEGSLAVYEW